MTLRYHVPSVQFSPVNPGRQMQLPGSVQYPPIGAVKDNVTL